MSWAQELKSLVEDIQAATVERLKFVNDVRKETADFLKGNKQSRLKDFKALHQQIQAAVKRIQKESAEVRGEAREYMDRVRRDLNALATKLAEFLKASERNRKADFTSMMEDIASALKEVKASSVAVRRDAQTTLRYYGKERAEAASHWASLHKGARKARAAAPAGGE